MEKVGKEVGWMLNMSILGWANSQARIEQKRAIRSVVRLQKGSDFLGLGTPKKNTPNSTT